MKRPHNDCLLERHITCLRFFYNIIRSHNNIHEKCVQCMFIYGVLFELQDKIYCRGCQLVDEMLDSKPKGGELKNSLGTVVL